MKLGQFIASSPSIFPDAYVQEFQRCLDRTPPLPFHYIRQMVESELGGSLEQLYAWVDPKPLASASIAQVHAARLKTGDEVVRIVEVISPGLSRSAISGVVEELQAGMMEECDFLLEAKHLKEFNEFLRVTGNTRAVAPEPYMDFSTRKVLTMERFHGRIGTWLAEHPRFGARRSIHAAPTVRG